MKWITYIFLSPLLMIKENTHFQPNQHLIPSSPSQVPLIPPDSSDDEDEDERHPPIPSTDLTYGDVGLYALGPGGKRLVDIAIVVSQLGEWRQVKAFVFVLLMCLPLCL